MSARDLRRWNSLDGGAALPRTLKLGRDRFGFSRMGDLVGDPTTRAWIGNSLALAFMVTVVTFLLALPLAFFSARREFPGKGLLSALVLVPMVLPPFVGAIGMGRMLSRFGSVNLVLMGLRLVEGPIDFLGAGRFWGVVLLEALHLYPIMYLNLAAAIANVDPSLEEAASTLGDHGLGRFRRVTLPLMLPGVFAGAAIVFVWAFTDLGTPLVLQYQEVAPKRIFDMVATGDRVNPQGYALVVAVLAISAALFALGRYLARRRPVEAGAKGAVRSPVARARPWERRLAYALYGTVIALALLPHLGVAVQAFAGRWFMTVLPEDWTMDYVAAAARHDLAASSVRTSIALSLASTGVDLALGVLIAVYVVRSRSKWAPWVDALATIPLAVPGLILAFGYVGAYSGFPLLDPRTSPFLLLVVAYSVRRLPYVVRSCVAGLEQTPRALEEASYSLGADEATTMRRVTMPLMAAHMVAGGILAFSFAMLEVSDSLVLAQRPEHYPLTKAIWSLSQRLVDGPGMASALGLFGMLVLAGSLWAASALVGRRMGEMFRA